MSAVPGPAGLAQRQVKDRVILAGMARGLAGGLVGTLVFDVTLVGLSAAAGLSPLAVVAVVGDTAAAFFARFGVPLVGGFPPGAVVIHLMGLGLGLVFGALVYRVPALRLKTITRGAVLGAVYVEIASQPLLALVPLLLPMTAADIWQWFAGSFVVHLVWGSVMGMVVARGAMRYGRPELVRPGE